MDKPPNVLFLLIDALRAAQCYGNKTKTPAINSLIENVEYTFNNVTNNYDIIEVEAFFNNICRIFFNNYYIFYFD